MVGSGRSDPPASGVELSHQTDYGQPASPAGCLLCAAIKPSGSALIRLTTAAMTTDLRCSIVARLDFRSLRDFDGIIHRDAQVSDGRFEFGVAEQQLHRTKVSRPPVDQRSLSPTHRVSSVVGGIQSQLSDPATQYSGVLPGAEVRRA